MLKILNKIKEQQERTGLRIINNPYTLGADVVDSNNKRVYSGDNISCQLFVSKVDAEISKYCFCSFTMIMRDSDDKAYCSECKKLVKEEL